MKKMFKKVLTTALAATMLFPIVACGGGKKNNVNLDNDDMSKHVTLTFWTPIQSWAKGAVDTLADSDVYKEIEKKFNVTIKFTHPVAGQETTQFNLMINKNELPDIISRANWYQGGIQRGIDEGAYLDLTDLIEEHAPDYYNTLKSNVNIERDVLTDEKKVGAFWGVSLYEEYPWYGPVLKKAWLDEAHLDVPETIADWEEVLTAFRDRGAEAPMIWHSSGMDPFAIFLSAYGVGESWYVDYETKQVKYGPVQEGFYKYLELMRDWYKKGLIDPNFSSTDWNKALEQITSGGSGAIMQSPDTMASYFEPKNIDWVAAPYPVLNEGDEIHYRQASSYASSAPNACAAISTSCENPIRAMKVLNYGYTKEGADLFNYGIKDRSYTEDADGNKTFTDLVLNNPNYTVNQTVWRYKMHEGTFIRDEHKSNPVMSTNAKSYAARESWGKIDASSVLPTFLTYTAAEERSFSDIMNDFSSYAATQLLKFILGQTNDLSSATNPDLVERNGKYQQEAAKLKLDEVAKVVQAAYNRYMARVS